MVAYAYEVDIDLNPKLRPNSMLPGTQRLVLTPGKHEKRHHLAGAFEPRCGRLVYIEGDRKASWLFLILLRALLEVYAAARTNHAILNNFIIHTSRVTRAWLAKFGQRIRLHFLPPYRPNENRIERIWLDNLHASATRNHRQQTVTALTGRVHDHLDARFETRRQVLLVA